MQDPTGRLITQIRDFPAVAAITPRVRGAERTPGWEGPFVIVRRLTSVPWIGDPGTAHAGVTTVRYTALCYAKKANTDERSPDGEKRAFDLAGAVDDAIAGQSFQLYAAGGGHAVIYSVEEDSIGGALRDPQTGEPFVPVLFTVLAATQVVAAS